MHAMSDGTANEDLRLREALLARAQAIAHLGSWRWDIASASVTWSDELYRIFGVDSSTFVPSNEAARALIHPDDRDQHLSHVLRALEGEQVAPFEARIVRPSGEERVVLASGFDVDRDAKGAVRVLFGAILDITDRKRMEAALRLAHEERAKAEAANHAKGIFLADMGHLRDLDEPCAVIRQATQLLGEFAGAQRVFYAEDNDDDMSCTVRCGYANGLPALEGRIPYAQWGATLLHAWRAGRTMVMSDEPSTQCDAGLGVRASVSVPVLGSVLKAVLFVQSAAPRHWAAEEIALFEGVAQRVGAEVERAHAEAMQLSTQTTLNAALAAMSDAVFISDASGQFLAANDAFATFHRLRSRAECPKQLQRWADILEIFLPDGTAAPLGQWPVPRALSGEMGSNVEYGLRRRDTGECWTGSYSFAPIRDAAGRIVGSVVVGRDVTAVKRMHEELAAAHADLQRLLAAQDSVQEQERLRIACELHDDVLQSLAGILMEASNVRVAAKPHIDAMMDRVLARIERIAAQAIKSGRRIIQDLRPQALDELGLVAALESLTTQFTQRTGVTCSLDAMGLGDTDEAHLAGLASNLYRIAQEALNNVAKHAGAHHVWLRLAEEPKGHVHLTVRDDGVGMAADVKPHRDAFGLLGMRERVRAAGGALAILGRPGEGTTISVAMPMPRPQRSRP
jgi:PAS domain S-box-containing protein